MCTQLNIFKNILRNYERGQGFSCLTIKQNITEEQFRHIFEGTLETGIGIQLKYDNYYISESEAQNSKDAEDFLKQNFQCTEKLTVNLLLLKELFFKGLLEGKIRDIELISNVARFYDLDITRTFAFIVCVIIIQKTKNGAGSDHTFQLQYIKETIYKIIKYKLNYSNVEVLYNSTGDNVIILLNLEEPSNNYMYLLKKIDIAIKKQITDPIYISVGPIVNEITNLPYSYKMAVDAIKCINIEETENSIIYATEIIHSIKRINYCLSKYEKELLQCILNRDCKKTIDIFNKLISNVLEQNISYEYFQQLIIKILSDIIKFLEATDINAIFIGRNLYKEVMDIKTVDGTIKLMQDLLYEIIFYLRKNNNTDHLSTLITDIINYVHDNYDKDINLEIVADHFSLSRQYFSKVFHDKVGKSFNDYLNMVRLNMSLVYLEETDLLVKDIAKKVGFSSTQYYIRLFKNKYGFTPGQYRNAM